VEVGHGYLTRADSGLMKQYASTSYRKFALVRKGPVI